MVVAAAEAGVCSFKGHGTSGRFEYLGHVGAAASAAAASRASWPRHGVAVSATATAVYVTSAV